MTEPVNPTAADLTLEEKASLTSGATFWTTKPVPRAGIPSIMVTDGPHGLRKQDEGADHLGIGGSVPATCFPPAAGLGSSWDTELVYRVGQALGVEASIEGVSVLLGPGINIKRSPLCGRNFEYYSEDPLVSGELGAALVNGVQSQGVGTSVKHFAANNQENERMRVSADIDARPLREIYLRGFERVVKTAFPWTIMCSYNKINGVYASEDPWLLTDVLRGDWGFKGLVMSDWGAVNDRVKGLPAGLDLEMPASGGRTDAQLIAAVGTGLVDEAALDLAANRVIDLVQKAVAGAGQHQGPLDVESHHALAREAAGRSIVMLKNDSDLLPLAKDARLAVIGAFAESPRYQGAGSSKINPTRLDSALEEIRKLSCGSVEYAAGFGLPGERADDAELRAQAVETARDADVATLFLGLPSEEESEGFDRPHMNLPAAQLELLDAVLAVNSNVVVVLSNGGVVEVPFADRVPAILEGWLLGQAGGGGTADVLFGEVNPSGKLTETIPVRIEDTPAYLDGDGDFLHVRYGEGIFVGYRWYDGRGIKVAFPFGHGLSYTAFEYGQASAEVAECGIRVRVPITNSGDRAGREVVQVYVSLPGSAIHRAPRELKAFASVALEPGETRECILTVPQEDLAYWDIRVDRWVVEAGEYLLQVGASSRDLRTSATVSVAGDQVAVPLSEESSLGDFLANPVVGPMLRSAMAEAQEGAMAGIGTVMPAEAIEAMISTMPVNRVALLAGDLFSPEMVQQLIAQANR